MSTSSVSPGADAVDLSRYYKPKSIAVIGAHETRPPNAGNTQRIIAAADAAGAAFYPVHPRFDTVFGRKCYHSVAEIPEDVDVAIIQVGDPIAAMHEVATKHAKFALVFTSGYSEEGTEGSIQRERDLVDAARATGIRLLGPNTNINSLEVRRQLPPPKIALVTQSAAQGRPIVQAEELGVAFSFWAATGNEADLEAADFMEFFASDPDTSAIACYIEGFKSGQRLREAAIAALERDVSIVLVKVGRSIVGQSMAASHTAHLTGSDAVYDAFFEQYGVTRVDDLDELLEVSVALARLPIPRTSGVVVYGMSGGTAAHLGDLAAAAGLTLPELSPATQEGLRQYIPGYLAVHNPVDNGGVSLSLGTGPDQMEVLMADPVLGVLLYAIPGVYPGVTPLMVDSLERAKTESDAPVLAIWSGPITNDPSYDRLMELQIPVFRNYRNAIRATTALVKKHEAHASKQSFIDAVRYLPPTAVGYTGETVQLDEADSAAWLAERGVVFMEHRSVTSVDGVIDAAEELGYPVVVKGRGARLSHKSDLGLVVVGLNSAEEVRSAASAMLDRGRDAGMEGFLVARQAPRGIELLVGISQDPVFGPVIAVGAGGVVAEAMKDVSVSVLPLLPSRARQMLERLRIAPLFDGWRGQPGVDKESLVDLLVTLGEIAAGGEVEELDINPVLAHATGYVSLDALVRLRR